MNCLDCGKHKSKELAFAFKGMCVRCAERRRSGEVITLYVNEAFIQDIRRQVLELRKAQKLVRVPLTSIATAMQIDTAMGLAGICLETLLWLVDIRDEPIEQPIGCIECGSVYLAPGEDPPRCRSCADGL